MTAPTRYTCEEVFRRLDDFLDRELSAEEIARVEEHLAACAQCAREHDFEASVLREIKQKVRRISAPSSLLRRIEELLGSDGARTLEGEGSSSQE